MVWPQGWALCAVPPGFARRRAPTRPWHARRWRSWGALDSRRRRQATFPFAHAERQNWHYVPRRREGGPLKDMAADVRTAALALLQVGLSAAGYAKARDVLRLEGVLRQLETFGGFTQDPDNYAVTIFGAPEQ